MKSVLFGVIVLAFVTSPVLGQWRAWSTRPTAGGGEGVPDKRVGLLQTSRQTAGQRSASLYVIGPRQISIIDLGTKKVVSTHPVDVGDAEMDPWMANHYFDGSSIWVPAGNSVLIVDAETFKVQGRVRYDSKPLFGIAVHPRLSVAYVVLPNENRVSVVDKASYQEVGSIPTSEFPCDIDVTPDGRRVFVPTRDSQRGTIHAIDTDTNQISGAIEVGEGAKPWMLTVSPDGKYIYTENVGDGTMAVVDISSMSLIKKIPAGKIPALNEFTPDGTFAYETIRGDGVVNVYDVSTHSLVKKVKVGANPIQIAVKPDGSEVYVANTGEKSISVISTVSNEVTETLALRHKPTALLTATVKE